MSENNGNKQECSCDCSCCCMNENMDCDKTLVRDLLKTVIMGSQAIDVTREYVASEEFGSYLTSLQSKYQELIRETEDMMRSKGISEDILSSVKEAFSRGMIKMGLAGTHSDEKVAEQLIKGTTMGIETIGKNLNISCSYSPEIIEHANKVESMLNESLYSLRKWLN